MPDESFKLLGPISVAIAVIAAWFMLRRYPMGRHASISQHAAAQRATYYLFAGVLTGAGLLFWLFLWRWFGPFVGAPGVFYLFLALGIVCQIITAWVPDTGQQDRQSRIHRKAAFTMAFMMAFMAGALVFAEHISLAARLFVAAVTAWMIISWFLFVFVKRTHQHFLVYQAIYIASFYAAVLFAAFAR